MKKVNSLDMSNMSKTELIHRLKIEGEIANFWFILFVCQLIATGIIGLYFYL